MSVLLAILYGGLCKQIHVKQMEVRSSICLPAFSLVGSSFMQEYVISRFHLDSQSLMCWT